MILTDEWRRSQNDVPGPWKDEQAEPERMIAFAKVPGGTGWLGQCYLLWRTLQPFVLDPPFLSSASCPPGPPLRILTLPLLLAWSVTVSSLLTTKAHAEWYAGVYGGIADPGAFSNATVSSPTLGGGVNAARVIDLELDNSGVFGAKVGYFFDTRPWLGFETEVFTLNPQVKEQTIVGGATSGKVFAEAFPATPLRVTPWVVNIIIRSPSMSDVFQPYGGMGYGLFFATSSKGGQSNTSINLGLNLFAGARYVLTPKTALFGEFKFNSSTIRFSDIKGDYESKIFVFGVMWHFNK